MHAGTARRLENAVAIVTGASFGIGRATAELFASHGAKVAVVGRTVPEISDVANGIVAMGGSAIALPADVADEEAVTKVVKATIDAFGPITTVVNNAGIMPPGTVLTTTNETWRRVLDVNLSSILYFARHAIPSMQASGQGGSIVNMASVQGLRGHPNRIAYATSKHAIIGITRALAADHARAGIRVNAVCPGTIDTPMLQRELEKVPKAEQAALLDSYRDLHPIGAIGDPIDVAYAALYLASREAKFVTGIELTVDGGYTSLIVHE